MQRWCSCRAKWITAMTPSLVVWFAATNALAQPTAQESWHDVPRVVVFGDVHGAYEAVVELLRASGVVGPDLEWTAGATHVVSLGDLLDRGPGARQVLELMMRLQEQARAAGGRLHVVLGNHELMNLMGDWRYVAAEEYAAFAAEESAELRAAGYAAVAAAAGDSPATREQFDRAFPRGYFARKAAFAPTGRYGQWLLTLPTMLVVNRTAYMHGGVPAVVAEAGLELNATVRTKLADYLALRSRLAGRGLLSSPDWQRDLATVRAALPTAAPDVAAEIEQFIALGESVELGVEGPLWYRGSLYCKPLLEAPALEAGLDKLGVDRVIVGHTPTADRRVHALYGGQLVAADTGMLAAYFRGQPAALLLDDGRIEVQYSGARQNLAVENDASAVVYGRTAAELRAALESGVVTRMEAGEDGAPSRVELRYEDQTIEALFYSRGRDRSSDRELAAAALDDLLGTDLVAPTVARAIGGEDGALQLRRRGSVTEAERASRGLAFSGWCPLDPQLGLMYTFDTLLANRGRSPLNVWFANDVTDLELTDHRQAFGSERALPPALNPGRLNVPPLLAARLRALDEAQLEAALGTWLDSRSIRALLARRSALLTARSAP
jgi:hypothetical protein